MVYQLQYSQQLPLSLEEAWSFFSSPKNLKAMTPAYMDFKMLDENVGKMYAGQIIQYTVKPVLGIPLRWVTEITHVREPNFFVDEQRKGPYKMWHHQHIFTVNDQGVLMQDIVTYEPPWGFIGQLLNYLIIKKQLTAIFSHRHTYLAEKYNAEA